MHNARQRLMADKLLPQTARFAEDPASCWRELQLSVLAFLCLPLPPRVSMTAKGAAANMPVLPCVHAAECKQVPHVCLGMMCRSVLTVMPC